MYSLVMLLVLALALAARRGRCADRVPRRWWRWPSSRARCSGPTTGPSTSWPWWAAAGRALVARRRHAGADPVGRRRSRGRWRPLPPVAARRSSTSSPTPARRGPRPSRPTVVAQVDAGGPRRRRLRRGPPRSARCSCVLVVAAFAHIGPVPGRARAALRPARRPRARRCGRRDAPARLGRGVRHRRGLRVPVRIGRRPLRARGRRGRHHAAAPELGAGRRRRDRRGPRGRAPSATTWATSGPRPTTSRPSSTRAPAPATSSWCARTSSAPHSTRAVTSAGRGCSSSCRTRPRAIRGSSTGATTRSATTRPNPDQWVGRPAPGGGRPAHLARVERGLPHLHRAVRGAGRAVRGQPRRRVRGARSAVPSRAPTSASSPDGAGPRARLRG